MRILVQRVRQASVDVRGQSTGQGQKGVLILVGFREGDKSTTIRPMVEKLVNLRIFEDQDGKMNRSLLEVGGDLVVVSQFTLYADCRKGRRPSFIHALAPEPAREMFEETVAVCQNLVSKVFQGEFGAEMQVSLVNDGPVTIMLDSDELGFTRVES